ncbi:UDP-glycosyltransferase 87a1 [Phtheirospermum japonicum]|uniref:UDP-glycosyltransferase 87a1 n=1 Tax=Phtheirospermum japonicum TaxID=374723 RepID=A0A830BS73_9LAMI|nr:UDP-glycosyltransferase 87a1 [Phtheirospermum japonicum]
MASPENKPTPPFHMVAMPYPGRGHINPMLNFCKAVAERRSDILITFVVTEEWLGLIGSTTKPPNISFASVPNVVPSERVRGDDAHGFALAVLAKMGEPFERLLDERWLAPSPDLIVADALLPWAAEAAAIRNIPMAYLWCMSASVYAMFDHFDLLVHNGHFPVDLSVNGDAVVDYIPGLSPIRLSDLPHILRDPETSSLLLKVFPSDSKSKYLIFDSISELESQVLKHLKQKSKFSIFNIGPADSYIKSKHFITSTSNTDDGNATDDEYYLNWLDQQPLDSVLYISLGSFLYVSGAQMDEIANGLQRSGVRFLWVALRETARLQEMCGKKGLVVDWCDQLRVLCHPSVGGFWSHCGWNSMKEAALAGVPMLTSPILMDQLPNAKVIVEDWRIGWRVSESEFGEENLVKGDEIKEIVGRFMELESLERGELVRNAIELKKVCEREFEVGGSFDVNLDGFVESILQRRSSTVRDT